MPRRDVSTPQGEKCLPHTPHLLELGAVLAILSAFALASCYISRTIDQATASDVNNRNFTFASGEVFHTALKNVSTALAFSNNAQDFTLCSGTATATGTNRFGSCSLTVTTSTGYSTGAGPQVGDVIKLDPCDFDSDDKTLTVSHGGITTTSTAATTGTGCSTATPATATNMSNQSCTFANGGVFHSALTNKSTVLAFDSTAQNFTLTSASVFNGTAMGTSSFGGICSLTVTTGYPSGTGPQAGTITLNPCTFDSSNKTLTVSNGTITAISASCTVVVH